MKKQILLTFLLLAFTISHAQKASDVLEDGIPIKLSNHLFLAFNKSNKTLDYNIIEVPDLRKENEQFKVDRINKPIGDSTIFLPKETFNVYIRPMNPLNFTQSTETKIIVDPINEATSEALGKIIEGLSPVLKTNDVIGSGDSVNMQEAEEPELMDICIVKFDTIRKKLENLSYSLEDNRKKKIGSIFMDLKAISFKSDESVTKGLLEIKLRKDSVYLHFKKMDTLIADIEDSIKKFDCGNYIVNYFNQIIFKDILKQLQEKKNDQYNRYTNLDKIYGIVQKEYDKVKNGENSDGIVWVESIDTITVPKRKIVEYKIIVKGESFKLSEDGEIVQVDPSEIRAKTIKFRKFQRFVPEVSVGVAYTNFTYNTYGTVSDSADQQFVGPPTENAIKNLKVSTMVNFNYYVQGWDVNFLYQVGIAINGEVPSLLTGLGIRLNVNGLRRLAISGGIAMTWVKELDGLSEGDKVSGTSEIDNAMKYQFSWPPKPYIGLQYNF